MGFRLSALSVDRVLGSMPWVIIADNNGADGILVLNQPDETGFQLFRRLQYFLQRGKQ
jgi:hypothetical protein